MILWIKTVLLAIVFVVGFLVTCWLIDMTDGVLLILLAMLLIAFGFASVITGLGR